MSHFPSYEHVPQSKSKSILPKFDQSSSLADRESQEDDINIAGERYDLLGTVFYIAYILSQ
jgi:hypothetical protein